MDDVLEYLEALACDTSRADHARLLERLEPAVRKAVLECDVIALRSAMGGRVRMVCSISLPNDDDLPFEEQPAVPEDRPDESEVQAA